MRSKTHVRMLTLGESRWRGCGNSVISLHLFCQPKVQHKSKTRLNKTNMASMNEKLGNQKRLSVVKQTWWPTYPSIVEGKQWVYMPPKSRSVIWKISVSEWLPQTERRGGKDEYNEIREEKWRTNPEGSKLPFGILEEANRTDGEAIMKEITEGKSPQM